LPPSACVAWAALFRSAFTWSLEASVYLKDRRRFAEERELRISLSALGIGKLVMDDRTEIAFRQHLHLDFDFRTAFANGTLREVICGPRCDVDFLSAELRRLGAEPITS